MPLKSQPSPGAPLGTPLGLYRGDKREQEQQRGAGCPNPCGMPHGCLTRGREFSPRTLKKKEKKKKTKKLIEAEPPGWLSPGPRTRDETSPGSFPPAPAGRPDSAGRQESPSSPCLHVPSRLPAQQGGDGTGMCL